MCQQATYASWFDHGTARGLSHLFQWHDRGDVDLDQHAGPSKLANGQQRVSGHRRRPERVLPALTEIGLIPDVGHISDHLHDIAKCGPVLFERTLDLVESVLALRREVALVKNVSALAVFILGTNTGEKDHLAGTDDRHGFRKPSLGPVAIVEVLLFEGLSRRYRRHDGKRQDHKGSSGERIPHVTISLTEC